MKERNVKLTLTKENGIEVMQKNLTYVRACIDATLFGDVDLDAVELLKHRNNLKMYIEALKSEEVLTVKISKHYIDMADYIDRQTK